MASVSLCSVDGCGKPVYVKKLGFCGVHYHRYRTHGDPTKGRALNGAGIAFIRQLVLDPKPGCILWPYGRMSNGYVLIRVDGRQTTAHRYALELFTGERHDRTMEALHNCGHGHLGCVNPLCLRWGTSQDNSNDMIAMGRQCRGSDRSRLTESQVLAIYSDPRGPKAIGLDYGIARQTVSHVKHGRSWAWLTKHGE